MSHGFDLPTLHALLVEQFPDLGVRTLIPATEGGDFTTVLASATARGPRPSLVFRFPRSSSTAALLLREVALLDVLRPRLGVAVPEYRWLGQPGARFPFPFGGYPLLPGVSGERLRPERGAWPALAPQWADLLATLATVSALELDALAVPLTPYVDLPTLRDRALNWRAVFERAGEALPPMAQAYLAGEGVIPPPAGAMRVLAHGDLRGEHLLLDPRTLTLSAVLDWTDARRGEPATDLAGLMIWLGPAFAARVWRALRHLPAWSDETTLARAVALARYGTLDRLGERLAGESESPLPLLRTQLARAFTALDDR